MLNALSGVSQGCEDWESFDLSVKQSNHISIMDYYRVDLIIVHRLVQNRVFLSLRVMYWYLKLPKIFGKRVGTCKVRHTFGR